MLVKINHTLLALFVALLLSCSFYSVAETPKDTLAGIEITVNVNTASAEELAALLKGIGLKKAQQIVEYRDTNGEFNQASDLIKVKGIGAITVENNASRILL